MGTVWSATGPTGRVAIKILRSDLAADPDLVDRFLRERTVLTTLRSPHIVAVRDLVVEGPRLAIVMDLVDGEELRRLIERDGSVAPVRALGIIGQVLAGLAAAHAAGVVHRDVKPENILLDQSGPTDRIALVDFGVAWITERAAMRATGIVGTPRYMAPEIAAGATPDDRADVYAAGVVLYELLFGRPPFAGTSVAGVLRAHREHEIERPPGVPDPLWAVLVALLARDPARRPSASAAATLLGRLPVDVLPTAPFAPLAPIHADAATLRDRPDPGPDTDGSRRATRRTGILLTVAVLVVAAIVWVAFATGTDGSGAACAPGRPVPAPAPPFAGDELVVATDDSGAPHAGKFFAGVWLGFGNSGVPGQSEARAMRDAGVLPATLHTVTVPFEEYRRLTNLPPDGSTFREWSARRRGAPIVYFVAVGGTVVPTDAEGLRRIGRDPADAERVPRYAFDRFRTPPPDGTLFRVGRRTSVVRAGRPVTAVPCAGARPVTVPASPRFADGVSAPGA